MMTARWVQSGYDSINPADHVEGDLAGEDPSGMSVAWRWREFSLRGGDPAPDATLYSPSPTFAWTSASTKPIRRTFRVQVPQGQYEVRVARVTPDVTDTTISSQVYVGQVKSVQPDTADYYGRTLVGVRIRATGQLNGVVSELSARVMQGMCVIQQVEGGPYSEAPSSNPGRVLYAWLRGQRNPAGRRLWGGGLPDSRIDVDALNRFASFCDHNSLRFDAVIDQSSMTVADVANDIARCGQGALSLATGKWGVVWDAPGLPVTAVFTPMNIKAGTFEIAYVSGDKPDEIVLTYIDRETWSQNTIRVPPDVESPQRSQNAELFGCVWGAHAAKAANLMYADVLYRSRRITWSADIEGLTVRKGDVISLSHDMTAWGSYGRLLTGSTTEVTLDRAVTLSGSQQYLAVVNDRGQYSVHRVQVGAGETVTLTLTDALADAPDDTVPLDWRWQFDSLPTPGWKVKVVSLEPANGFDGVKISAVDELDEYYEAATGTFARAQYRSNSRLPVLSNLIIGEELIRAGAGYAVRVALTWFAAGEVNAVRMRYAIDGGPLVDAGFVNGNRAEIVVPDLIGVVAVEVVGYNAAGQSGLAAKLSGAHTIRGSALPPPNVPYFMVNGDRLTWGDVAAADLDGYRIRWQPGNNTSWYDANALHTGLLTDSPYDLPVQLFGPVTLMIRAVDVFGNESEYSAIIRTELGGSLVSNVVEFLDEQVAGFLGVKTACSVVSGVLQADDATDRMWKPDGRAAMWQLDGDDMWHTEVWSAMTYSQTITPTLVKAGARLVIDTDIVGETWSISYRVLGAELMWSVTDSDAMWMGDAEPMWSGSEDWFAWPGSLLLDGGTDYEVLVAISQGAPLRGAINKLDFIVDNPDVIEKFSDIAISAGGTRLPIEADYTLIKNVSCTLQDDGGAAVTLRVIDKSHSAGPLIKCFNAAGSSVSGSIDATVQGY